MSTACTNIFCEKAALCLKAWRMMDYERGYEYDYQAFWMIDGQCIFFEPTGENND